MKIGLLGSLSVVTREGGVRVAAGQQRIIIARLAAEPGKLVALDELIAAVWDESPPRNAKDSIRTLIFRTRERLGKDSGLIITEDAGYRLDVPPGDVDMTAFEALCRAGQTEAIAGDWHRAQDTFLEAEYLWRGAPFANVPSKKLREAHVPHLEQLFATARQTRIEASVRLSLRACDAAANELARLAEEHPEREHLRWLLMLALYRAGRRHDAQSAFLECREHSVREFGVEPGQDIQDLNNRIHGADPALLNEPFA